MRRVSYMCKALRIFMSFLKGVELVFIFAQDVAEIQKGLGYIVYMVLWSLLYHLAFPR